MLRALMGFALGYAACTWVSARAAATVAAWAEMRLAECRATLDQAAERLCLADIALGPCWETAEQYQRQYLKLRGEVRR